MYHGALRTLREITTCVPDFSTDHFDTCRGCAMGKFAKSPFPSSDNRATGILDLIHSDVSGWMSHVSLSGYEYYVLFIDDHSRRTWIYFLKTKSEVFKQFQEFRALVETQTGRKIKSRGRTMEESTPLESLLTIVRRQALGGSSLFLTTPSRTGLQRGRTDPS